MKFNVTGMGCAMCQQRVEKAALEVAGVESAVVSLLTNSMEANGDFDAAAVCEAVKAAGYGCEIASPSK